MARHSRNKSAGTRARAIRECRLNAAGRTQTRGGGLIPFLAAVFSAFCALVSCLGDTQAGLYGMCAIAWISFFAFALGKDYSGGLYVGQTAQIFLAALTVVVCMPGPRGELGRAILLGILPVYAAFAMLEFFRRLKSRDPLGILKPAE